MKRNGSFTVLSDGQCFENIYGLHACILLNGVATLLVLESSFSGTKIVPLIRVLFFF